MVQGSAAQIADGKIILFTVNSVLILSVLRAHIPDAGLEHITPLTPHYAVPWTTAIDFRFAKHTASPHAVWLVARQNPPPERWNSRDSSRQHYLSLPLEGTRRFYDVKSLADHRTTSWMITTLFPKFVKHGKEVCLQQNLAFCGCGLLFASCLFNTITYLSSDYGDYLFCSASRSHKVAQSQQHEPHSIPFPLVL